MIKTLLAVLLIFSGLSLAQQPDRETNPDQAKAQVDVALGHAGCGPYDARFDVKVDKSQHPFVEPEAGKALVYVFEEDQTTASPTTRVGLDGKWMGANTNDSYFFFAVDPGDHRLCTNWQEKIEDLGRLGGALHFNAEAGKIYYFRTRITERRSYSVDLRPANSAEGQFLISSHFLSTSHVKKPAN